MKLLKNMKLLCIYFDTELIQLYIQWREPITQHIQYSRPLSVLWENVGLQSAHEKFSDLTKVHFILHLLADNSSCFHEALLIQSKDSTQMNDSFTIPRN